MSPTFEQITENINQGIAVSLEEDEMGFGKCFNEIGRVSCNDRNCRNPISCQNPVTRYLRTKSLVSNLVPKKSRTGLGLVSEVDIEDGVVIMEYIGEFVVKNSDMGYSFKITSSLFLSALDKGNSTRFINHGCKPNAQAEVWSVDGYIRVFVFSKRSIVKNTFITLDYGNEYTFPRGCRCDSCYSK